MTAKEIDRERVRRRAAFERKEAELEAAVRSLKNTARERLRPRVQLSRHPYRVLGGALLLGLWLGH